MNDGYDVRESLCDRVRGWARETPDAPAFLQDGLAAMSYAVLAWQIDAVIDLLRAEGIRPGHRIAIVHRGGVEAAALFLGVVDLATAVPLNPVLPADELAGQIAQRRVDAIIMESALETPARRVADDAGLPAFEAAPDGSDVAGKLCLKRVNDQNVGVAMSDPSVAYVLATSGTTGRPKVVPITQRILSARSALEADYIECTSNDRMLSLNRQFLDGGIGWTCATLWNGGSTILGVDWTPDEVLRQIETLRPTMCAGSFAIHHALYERLSTGAATIGPHALKFAHATSGAIDPRIADALERLLGTRIIEGYASSEAGRITGNPPPPGHAKRGTVGPAFPSKFKLVDEDGEPVGVGSEGEILVRGESVFAGYEGGDEANAEAFTGDWFRTGDRGFLDENGYLKLTGRSKEMINRGGEKIYPTEIDRALMEHPAIADAAAFGIPHPTLGEIAGAAVVARNETPPGSRELSDFLKTRLSPFKRPATFIYVAEIPRGPGGKVQRNDLREAFSGARDKAG